MKLYFDFQNYLQYKFKAVQFYIVDVFKNKHSRKTKYESKSNNGSNYNVSYENCLHENSF